MKCFVTIGLFAVLICMDRISTISAEWSDDDVDPYADDDDDGAAADAAASANESGDGGRETIPDGCDVACIQAVIPHCGVLRVGGQVVYKTFSNLCVLGLEKCNNPDTDYKPIGRDNATCDEQNLFTQCSSLCTAIYQPVCGVGLNQYGRKVYQTFGNICEFWGAFCKEPIKQWRKAYNGQCCY